MFVSKNNFFKFVFAVIALVSASEGFATDVTVDLDENTQSATFMTPVGTGRRAARRTVRRTDRRDDYQETSGRSF